MNTLQVLILSCIEGITEFLPISSTGHLILTTQLLQIPQTEFMKTFEIVIQFGAILAIFVLYSRTLIKKRTYWKPILLAFLPAGLIGFILYKLIKSILLENSYITVVALILGGLILILFEHFMPKKTVTTIEKLTIKQSLLIGIGQSLAIIPGVSRSAASIISGMIVGLSREQAVEFSFFLALPTITAATIFDLIKSSFNFTSQEFTYLGLGTIFSFIFALFTIKFFLKYVKNHSFVVFGVYRIILGLFFLFFI